MTLTHHTRGAALVITPQGRLDALHADAFDQAVELLLQSQPRQVVVDCGSVEYASSAGLRCLLALAKRMQALGVQTVIHTDIGTDGMLTGPNFPAQEAMLAAMAKDGYDCVIVDPFSADALNGGIAALTTEGTPVVNLDTPVDAAGLAAAGGKITAFIGSDNAAAGQMAGTALADALGTAPTVGLIAGPACYAGAVWLKHALKYDDSLDAFGVHGVGGIVGEHVRVVAQVHAAAGRRGDHRFGAGLDLRPPRIDVAAHLVEGRCMLVEMKMHRAAAACIRRSWAGSPWRWWRPAAPPSPNTSACCRPSWTASRAWSATGTKTCAIASPTTPMESGSA